MHGHACGCHCPVKEDPEEPQNYTHEVNLDSSCQARFKPQFEGVVGRVVHEVVHAAASTDGCSGKVWVSTDEDAGIVDALTKPHVQQVSPKAIEPMTGQATQLTEGGLAQFPAGPCWGRDRTSRRRNQSL
jgi:hypothetical protein